MKAFDLSKLYRFSTGYQTFETVIYRKGSIYWLSLPSRDINGKPLDGNNRDVYRSLRQTFPGLNFVSAEQTHSNNVLNVKAPSEFVQEHNCDGLITQETDTALIIRTADCLPVFIFNNKSVALLHAGHKGIKANILQNWNSLSSNDSSQLIVGDHIKSCCFKVRKDVENIFRNLNQFNQNSIVKINQNQWSISLVKILRNQWNSSKRSFEHFFDYSNCTCCNENMHSYRRSGRNLAERSGHVIFRLEAQA